MNPFSMTRDYDDAHKIINYLPTFNTSSKLEFNIMVRSKHILLKLFSSPINVFSNFEIRR